MKKLILIIVVLFSITSCTDAQQAKLGGYGDRFKVEILNCDGSVTHSWISSGKVSNSESSDGYYFNDEKTGNLIEVSGSIIITKL